MRPVDRLRRLAEGDEPIAEKTRLAIMLYLSVNGRTSFGRLEKELGLTSGNLASHLKKLEEKEYVRVRRSLLDARARVIDATPLGLAALADFIVTVTGAAEQPQNASQLASETSPLSEERR